MALAKGSTTIRSITTLETQFAGIAARSRRSWGAASIARSDPTGQHGADGATVARETICEACDTTSRPQQEVTYSFPPPPKKSSRDREHIPQLDDLARLTAPKVITARRRQSGVVCQVVA